MIKKKKREIVRRKSRNKLRNKINLKTKEGTSNGGNEVRNMKEE
jgi:hypothetical protein